MYPPHIGQVYKDHNDGDFDTWVLYLSHEAGTKAENFIDSKHRTIDIQLREQNVNFSEITTLNGRQGVYKKFNLKNCKHPIFLVFNKLPKDVVDGDHFLIFEWGKWQDSDSMQQDVMALVNFFSDEEFREKLSKSKDMTMWKKTKAFLGKNGLTLLGLAVGVAGAG